MKCQWRFVKKPQKRGRTERVLLIVYVVNLLIASFFFAQDAYQTDCCKRMVICSTCVKTLKITSPNARFDPANSYTFSAAARCPFCQTPKYRCIPNHPVRRIIEKFAVFMKNYEEERKLDAVDGRRRAEENSRKREEERKKKEVAEKARRDEEERKREEQKEKERKRKEEEQRKKRIEEQKKKEEREKKKKKEQEAKRKKEQEKKRREAEERKRAEAKKKEEKKREEEKRKKEASENKNKQEMKRPDQKRIAKEKEEKERGRANEEIKWGGTQNTAWLTPQLKEKLFKTVISSTVKTLCLLS